MTTDQPTPTSSLEEARLEVVRAVQDYGDGGVLSVVLQRLVDFEAAARAEVIREVEAVLSEHDLCGENCVPHILVEDIRARLRALSQGGEGKA